ncbi:GNL3L protein, partial [Grantiella picta]|nr:GNL3L protein [Grantiella picta]
AEFPTVAFKACTQQQSRNLKQSRVPAATAPEEVLAGGACVGAESLLHILSNYGVGVALSPCPQVRVWHSAPVPRCLQAVQLDRHIRLLDCPGVVLDSGDPPAAAPLRGALAPQRLRDPLTPACAILRRCPPEQVRGD